MLAHETNGTQCLHSDRATCGFQVISGFVLAPPRPGPDVNLGNTLEGGGFGKAAWCPWVHRSSPSTSQHLTSSHHTPLFIEPCPGLKVEWFRSPGDDLLFRHCHLVLSRSPVAPDIPPPPGVVRFTQKLGVVTGAKSKAQIAAILAFELLNFGDRLGEKRDDY